MRAVPLPLFVDEVVVARLPDKLANLVVAQGNAWYGRPNGPRFAHCGFIRFLSKDKRGRSITRLLSNDFGSHVVAR